MEKRKRFQRQGPQGQEGRGDRRARDTPDVIERVEGAAENAKPIKILIHAAPESAASTAPPCPDPRPPAPPGPPPELHSKPVNSHVALPRACQCHCTSAPNTPHPHLGTCQPPPYAYLAMNALWNLPIRSTTASISSSGGRNVVRKCHVPATWPKPEPGTTTMPVSSRSASA